MDVQKVVREIDLHQMSPSPAQSLFIINLSEKEDT